MMVNPHGTVFAVAWIAVIVGITFIVTGALGEMPLGIGIGISMPFFGVALYGFLGVIDDDEGGT